MSPATSRFGVSDVIAVIAIVVPTILQVSTWISISPSRHIQIYDSLRGDDSDSMASLPSIGLKAITVDDRPVNNYMVALAWIRNSGNSPIRPDDYDGPIRLSTSGPWEILKVIGVPDPESGLVFEWEKSSSREFVASQSLLNPGDRALMHVYLTKADGQVDMGPPPKLSWVARIENLQPIEYVARPDSLQSAGVMVVMFNESIAFTIVFGAVLLFIALAILHQASGISSRTTAGKCWIAVLAALSFSAGESLSSTLFLQDVAIVQSKMLNTLVVGFYSVLMFALWLRGRFWRRKVVELPHPHANA